jgi:hypothetical protein
MTFDNFVDNILTPFFSVVEPVDVILWLFLIPVVVMFFKAMLFSFNAGDLIKDDATGKVSHSKLWANIAYLASTIAFLHINLHSSTDSVESTGFIWFVYLSVVAGNSVANKWLTLKYLGVEQKAQEEQQNQPKV